MVLLFFPMTKGPRGAAFLTFRLKCLDDYTAASQQTLGTLVVVLCIGEVDDPWLTVQLTGRSRCTEAPDASRCAGPILVKDLHMMHNEPADALSGPSCAFVCHLAPQRTAE